MKTAEELFETAIIHWREKRCVGSCIIPSPLDDKYIVLGVLQRIYSRSPTANITIFIDDFKDRLNLIEFLTNQEDKDNNEDFKFIINNKYLKFLSIDYVERNGIVFAPYVAIVYHCNSIEKHLEEVIKRCKFKLFVLNKLMDAENMKKLYSLSPLLDDFKQNELDELRTNILVKDNWIGIDIPEDSNEYNLLKQYDEFITTSISIFGSLDKVKEVRTGNQELNISSNQICYRIAKDNGWNEHLDMSVEINVQLDNLYNPNNLKERATMTYDIIRSRSKLLSDYEGKLDIILDIVESNKDKRILIINKYGEFASKVTDYINQLSENVICGNYHDKVEPIFAVDDLGNYLLYKSGPNKGKRRTLAAQAQKTYNEQLFNRGSLRILSANSAPDKSLSVPIDIIIITSPQCEDIKSYIYRLNKVYYPSGEINLYNIYVKNSIEQTKLETKNIPNNYENLTKNENSIITENNSDFVIVD